MSIGNGEGIFGGSGGSLQPVNNLSDVANVTTSRTNLGLGTVATQNTGTAAGNIPQLNGTGQLPAIDGSLLTNLPAGGQTVFDAIVDSAGGGDFTTINAAVAAGNKVIGLKGNTTEPAGDIVVAGSMTIKAMEPNASFNITSANRFVLGNTDKLFIDGVTILVNAVSSQAPFTITGSPEITFLNCNLKPQSGTNFTIFTVNNTGTLNFINSKLTLLNVNHNELIGMATKFFIVNSEIIGSGTSSEMGLLCGYIDGLKFTGTFKSGTAAIRTGTAAGSTYWSNIDDKRSTGGIRIIIRDSNVTMTNMNIQHDIGDIVGPHTDISLSNSIVDRMTITNMQRVQISNCTFGKTAGSGTLIIQSASTGCIYSNIKVNTAVTDNAGDAVGDYTIF